MTVYADELVSGAGEIDFGDGRQIFFILAHTVNPGSEATPLETGSPDHVLRVGWVALGNDASVSDFGTLTYWLPPMWINILNTEFTPVPATDGAGHSFAWWGRRIRWQLSFGATVWLHVEGA